MVEPAATAVASPLGEIVAIGVPDELQVTEAVRSAVELSEYVPVAVNCWVAPTVLLESAGVTAIEVRVGAPGAVTVSVVFPETAPDEAVIVVEPTATAVASPLDEIVAIDVPDELQVTEAARSAVELSEYVPVAVNCWVAPTVLLGFAGVTAIEVRTGAPGAAVTVSVVLPETAPDEAVIVVEPAETAVDMPPDEIVAIDVLDELQVTDDVRFTAELSEYVPMAVNCWVAPMVLFVLAGVMAIDVRDGVMTLLPLLPPPPHATRKAIEIIPANSCADRLFILVPPFFAVGRHDSLSKFLQNIPVIRLYRVII